MRKTYTHAPIDLTDTNQLIHIQKMVSGKISKKKKLIYSAYTL